MSRALALAGLIAIAFGAGSTFAADSVGPFNVVNVALGSAALVASAILGLLHARGAGAPAFRAPLVRGAAGIALALVAAVGMERAAAWSGIQLDWSFEGKYAPSEATLTALHELCPVDASLYFDPGDPRIRSTHLLLQTLARDSGCLTVDERNLDDHPDDEDRYAIGSSNTVVLRVHPDGRPERYETVERPSEATLYEALFHLRELHGGTIYVARGAGEGDVELGTEAGFSGLAAALQTEGYRLHEFVAAASPDIPQEATAVLWIAPQRPLPEGALRALERYLEGGGRLVAMFEPGVSAGLGSVVARWGITPAPGVVVDPASVSLDGEGRGLAPLVYSYDTRNPVCRGLGPGRMTFFHGARTFELRKPQVEDRIQGVAFSSPHAWVWTRGADPHARVVPDPPPDVRHDYLPLVVTGQYRRHGHETRIVAFGDSELASNAYLRTLYNLDLVLNAVHWAASREPAITLRPKTGVSGRMQFPIPIQNTLTMFQSLGLLLPELLLIAAAVLWVRSRSD